MVTLWWNLSLSLNFRGENLKVHSVSIQSTLCIREELSSVPFMALPSTSLHEASVLLNSDCSDTSFFIQGRRNLWNVHFSFWALHHKGDQRPCRWSARSIHWHSVAQFISLCLQTGWELSREVWKVLRKWEIYYKIWSLSHHGNLQT